MAFKINRSQDRIYDVVMWLLVNGHHAGRPSHAPTVVSWEKGKPA